MNGGKRGAGLYGGLFGVIFSFCLFESMSVDCVIECWEISSSFCAFVTRFTN